MTSPEVHLEEISTLSSQELLALSLDLFMCRWRAPGFVRELPLAAKGYVTPVHAYRRLMARISAPQDSRELRVFHVRLGDINTNAQTIGLATSELTLPNPQLVDQGGISGGKELSYWHRKLPLERAVVVGQQIVGSLITNKGSEEALNQPWMVTLPDDTVKQAVCSSMGFKQVGEAQPFDIGDDVTEPRQLWVKSFDGSETA